MTLGFRRLTTVSETPENKLRAQSRAPGLQLTPHHGDAVKFLRAVVQADPARLAHDAKLFRKQPREASLLCAV